MATKKKTKAELQAELSKGKNIADVAAETETVKEATTTDIPADTIAAVLKEKGPGKIAQILAHFKAGKSPKEIAGLPFLDENGNPVVTGKDADGNDVYETFHTTTISIQVNKYKKANPDLYPPQPPAPTKAEVAAAKKATKEKEAAEKAAITPPSVNASAEANVQA